MTYVFRQLGTDLHLGSPMKKQNKKNFSSGFWIIAENKLCDQQVYDFDTLCSSR